MRSILIEGASTAVGVGSVGQGGWAGLLSGEALKWNARHLGRRINVSNHAVISNTTIGINRHSGGRLRQVAEADDESPVVILAVGQMEARTPPPADPVIVNLQRFTTALALFSERIVAAGGLTVYVGPQPVDETKTQPMETGWFANNNRISAYAAAIREQAETDAMPYVDAADLIGDPVYLADDGRHPNNDGYELLYGGIRQAPGSLGVFMETMPQQYQVQ